MVHIRNYHNGVVVHVKPDILECEAKWASISWREGSLMGFLELRQARGVYSRVTTGPILNGSLFSEVRTLV